MPVSQRERAGTLVLSALIVVVGVNLRSVLLGVPPLLATIERELALSHAQTGLLTALPVLCLGLAALPAGLLAARLGGRLAVAIGLALLAVGGALRAVWPAALALYSFTVVLSLGVALAQTAVLVLIRHWFPSRIGLTTALYTDGIIIGEILGASLTVPVILGWLGDGAWRGSFVVWSAPVAVVVLLWLWLAPRGDLLSDGAPAPAATTAGRWPWPLALRLGLLSGAGSLIYFGMNAWIAPANAAQGQADATSLALTVLNAGQLPVSLAVTLVAQRLAGRRWPFVATGVVCLVASLAFVQMPAGWQPLWAALLGGSSASVLVLGFALPPLLATRESVARLAGLTLTLSYSVALLGPLAGGWLWDLFGRPSVAFLPVTLASLLLIVMGGLLPASARDGREQSTPARLPAAGSAD